jgi:hypothetical protein
MGLAALGSRLLLVSVSAESRELVDTPTILVALS